MPRKLGGRGQVLTGLVFTTQPVLASLVQPTRSATRRPKAAVCKMSCLLSKGTCRLIIQDHHAGAADSI